MTGFHSEMGFAPQRIETHPVAEPLLLTAKQTAVLLGVSIRHLYKLHSGGRLPRPLRLGRAVRWRRDEIIAWIEAGTLGVLLGVRGCQQGHGRARQCSGEKSSRRQLERPQL